MALAAWALARRGRDPEFVALAAASVARLTHAETGARADACLVALVALERAVATGDRAGERAAAARSLELATRFGGGTPSGRLGAVWAALERFPAEPAQASARCVELGGDGPTAAALAGMGAEVVPPATDRWRSMLEALKPR